ncbi:Alpha/Beta hydrolase protein [Xylariales sp. AK1849]|nr:Alpha/Beta hydrolase protein [Xylariales sp. AK1849]
MAHENGPKRTAPYGQWESEIDKEAIFSSSWTMRSPRVCRRTGRAFFGEDRPDGKCHLMELRDGKCKDVLPDGFSARSQVYEYGGGAYAILPGARLIFTDPKDKSINILDVDSGNVSRLIQSETLRYADFDAHPGDEPWVLAIEEDHEIDVPEKVKNYIVAINTDTGEVKRIVEGADFYMFPSFSHDGKKVCWTEWNFGGMPWAGVRLFWADWAGHGLLPETVKHVAGTDSVTVAEPRWGPDGYLYFCQEQTNYRQLYRRKPGDGESALLELPGLENVEFGSARMACGSHSYAILSKDLLVASYSENGESKIILAALDTLAVKEIPLSISDVTFDGVERLSDNSFLVISGSSTSPEALYKIDIKGDTSQPFLVRMSTDQQFSASLFSVPEHIQFPAKRGVKRDIYGFFWPPHNARFKAPEGDKPPLILQSHGGPTAHTPPGLILSLQYWNTRGFATFAINYSGSDGYGKEFRELLNGKWGIIDRDDVAECVEYLVETGRVDGSKVGIRGGSAGGYSVLQALCSYPDIFAGGVCLYGISELKLLLGTTHKMEARYGDQLVFTEGMTQEERLEVMKDRSPVYHASNITAPLLLLHGEDDEVVPISQAYTMYEDIMKRGGDVKLVKFPGEGHGFKNGVNRLKSHEEEETWWRRTLVKS